MGTITKNIGKNTLGDNNKMRVDLRTYNRSTHNLSYAWRNTQGVGTLVPCMKLLALPGDTFDINIDAKVLTHPTVGPLFGSYKLQVDIFTCPIRLYQAMLHNNALNVGLDMSKVKLPKFNILKSSLITPTIENQFSQIHPSCVLAYLGQRGWTNPIIIGNSITRNAVPMLAYLDIFKNYYANKQESNFYYLNNKNFGWTETNNIKIVSGKVTGTTAINTDGDIEEIGFLFGQLHRDGSITNKVTYSYDEILKYATATTIQGTTTFTFGAESKEDLYVFGKSYIGAVLYPNVNVVSSPLEELDDLREAILASGTTEFKISSSTNSYFQNLLYTNNGVTSTSLPSAGLLLKTHQSDLFNNWINTEWIDGENGISAITAIDTSGGEFTIDTLNLAKKVYDMLNRIAVSGGSYRDWIETVYTSDYTIHAESPIYEGGMSDEIVFQEVVSNSATEEEPLGTLAGRGTLAGMRKGGKLHIKVNEPSYIIGICSITPRVDYCQGNDFDVEFETMNDLHKPQLDGIGYEDLGLSNCVWWKKSTESYGKTVAWIHYMTNFNKSYGNFAIEGNEAFMCLNRFFTPKDTSDAGFVSSNINTTSYINPADFNYVFADTSAEAQNFWVQLGFGINARRVMSAKQIPNL